MYLLFPMFSYPENALNAITYDIYSFGPASPAWVRQVGHTVDDIHVLCKGVQTISFEHEA